MSVCFALLDDASAADPRHVRSRLYSGHVATLACHDAAGWPQVLAEMQAALQRGLYAVPVMSYELGCHLMGVQAHPLAGPLAQVLLFDSCTHMAPPDVAAWLDERAGAGASAGAGVGAGAGAGPGTTEAGIAAVRANVDQAEFTRALGRIHDYIEAGHTYQVNYTYRLRFDAFGSVFALYARLRARQPVPYGALVGMPGGGAILSLSPELFVRHAGGELVTRPMKGTAPASEDNAENARRAAALAADLKNRAENLMIVDLLRNDLGRIAVTGSVQVPALFDVQRYSSVLQMTSTVRAQLRPDATLEDVFTALYPCGSITGAPKRRTMEIISELEPAARGVYTGAIGWFDPPSPGLAIGDFCLSVPIRTLALQSEQDGVRRGEMGVGAGIVFDSDARDEYAECQLKARFLTGLENAFEIFETMQASDEGCARAHAHLARLQASAAYFGYPLDIKRVQTALGEACARIAPGVRLRLRLALWSDGQATVTTGALAPLAEPVKIFVSEAATHAGDIFLRHKTGVRAGYDAAWREAEARGGFDCLFFNERGELTEGGRSNVFIMLDGRWWTPPLLSGVLPGIMRAEMLADPAWNAQERVITRAMLEAASKIIVCNSLRGAMAATLCS